MGRYELSQLTSEQLDFFNKNGYAGPFPLLKTDVIAPLTELMTGKVKNFPVLKNPPKKPFVKRLLKKASIAAEFLRTSRLPPKLFYKSAHALIPEISGLGSSTEIVERIKSILGEDLILWSSELITQKPGKKHRWHEDIEHTHWEGATAWLALANATKGVMKVITGSHKFGTAPQDIKVDLQNDETVLKEARKISKTAKIVSLDIKPGEFFIFAGRTWHATANDSELDRTAMIFQYAPAREKIRIPLNFENPVKWDSRQPPVQLVSGKAPHTLNHLTSPRKESESLKGKTAVVTGGSRGIGLAIAAKLAARGTTIAILSRNSREGKSAISALTYLYDAKVIFEKADVTDEESIAKAFKQIEKKLGQIDILVNNAGLFKTLCPVWETDSEHWFKEIMTNLGGAFLCSRACIPSMLKQNKGIIINIIGGGAGNPIPHGSAYASSKAALTRFTECLAEELKETPIRIFGLDPGFIRTRMTIGNATSENGRKWRPQIKSWLDNNTDVSPTPTAEVAACLAEGHLKQLHGRVLPSTKSLNYLNKRMLRREEGLLRFQHPSQLGLVLRRIKKSIKRFKNSLNLD